MNGQAYKKAFAGMTAVTVFLLVAFAYAYGDMRGRQAPPRESPRAIPAGGVLVGRIVQMKPLHFYVESASFGPSRVYDVLLSPSTRILSLVPWEHGEREKAVENYHQYIDALRPKAGDPVLPPPPSMKPVPLDPSALKAGISVGIRLDAGSGLQDPLVAEAIRPLTPEEAASGQVANSFPLQ